MNNLLIIKRAYTYAFALFIAAIISYYFSLSEKCWLILTTFLVMQTAIGVTLRQGMQRYLLILFSVAIGTLFSLAITQPIVAQIAAILFFSLGCYFSLKKSPTYFYSTMPFLLGMLVSIVLLLPSTTHIILYARLYDVTLGAILGIAINLLIFPVKVDAEFRNNLIPVLNSYVTYLFSITDLLFRNDSSQNNIDENRLAVEKNLQTQSAFFPNWVYESGLSMTLQPGYRHFIIMIERVAQILFSTQSLARHSFQTELLQEMQIPFRRYIEQVKKIIDTLIIVLSLKTPAELVGDLSEEIDALEAAFKKAVPLSIELLDMSPDYILFAALIEDLKDLRVALVRLGQAVRFSS